MRTAPLYPDLSPRYVSGGRRGEDSTPFSAGSQFGCTSNVLREKRNGSQPLLAWGLGPTLVQGADGDGD